MELKPYFAPLLKWWWLVLISTGIAVGSTFVLIRNLPPTYRARTTLMVGNSIYDPAGGQITRDQQLAGMYVAIALQDNVRRAAQLALQLEWIPNYDVRQVGNGVFIEVAAVDTDARRAQAVVNEVARQLKLLSPSATSQAEDGRLAFVNAQLDRTEADIKQTQVDIAKKQDELGKVSSASELSALRQEIAALQDKYSLLQTNYSNLLANTPQSFINTINVLEPAQLPQVPIGPNRNLLLLIAALGGGVLSIGAAYLMEYLDNTLKTSDEISRLFQLPLIGHIPLMERTVARKLYMALEPHSAVAEAFRSLRTNLEFVSVEQPLRTVLITSTGEGEGKTTVALNLAMALAQSGKRVVLVDADLRKPKIGTFFEFEDQEGLSDILRGQAHVSTVVRAAPEAGISVLLAGVSPPNPAELLSSKRMEHVLASLQELADVVIVDGPPFVVADAWVLAARVDGVMLVVRPGNTHRNAVHGIFDQLKRGRVRMLGIVLNRVSRQTSYYYGTYRAAAYTNNKPGRKNGKSSGTAAKPRRWPFFFLARNSSKQPSTVGEESSSGILLTTPLVAAERFSAKRERATLNLFLDLSRELAAAIDLPARLKRLLQLTLEGVGASSGSIVVLAAAKPLAGAMAYAGEVYVPTTQQLSDTLEVGLAGWVVANRQPVLLTSTREDARWLQRPWDTVDGEARSAICIPLLAQDRVFGVLTLVHPRAGKFDDDDLTLLKTIGVFISSNAEALLNGAGEGAASATPSRSFSAHGAQPG